MPRLTRAQHQARQRIAGLAGQWLPPERLAAALLAALLEAVPADGAGLAGLDPATLLYSRPLAMTPGSEPNARHYLSRVYLADPAVALTPPGMMRAGIRALVVGERLEPALGVPADVVDQLSPRAQAEAYRAIPGPPGGVLRAMFPADGGWAAGLEMLRFDPARPFEPHDVTFLHLVAPVIGRALRAALDHERAVLHGQAVPEQARPSGILLLAPNGRVRFQTPAAEAWLRALRAAEGGGGGVPLVVWSTLAGLRAGASGAGGAVVRVPTPMGPLRIEATPSDERGGIAIVLTPECPPPLPTVPASWGLTAQERRVVALLLCGASNRQLAGALGVSDNTVETHLRHIYEKVGVRGRQQVLAQFFRETARAALPGEPREPGEEHRA